MKIFVSDLDGTLIDGSFKSDDLVFHCIEKILDAGHIFIAATGRTLYGIQALDFYELPIYSIIMNGAVILDKQKQVLYRAHLDENFVKELYIHFANDSIEYISENKNYLAISKDDYIKRYSNWNIWKKKMNSQENLKYLLSHMEFEKDINSIATEIVKINILEQNDFKYVQKECFIKQFCNIGNNPFVKEVFELTPLYVSKKEALFKLINLYNWNTDDVYVFGDGDNDSDLLASFKHSYAPLNASEKAKMSARNVVGPCNQKSIVKTMMSLI